MAMVVSTALTKTMRPWRSYLHSRPWWKLSSHLVLQILKVDTLWSCDRQRKTKISHGEGSPDRREGLENVVKVNVAATNGRHKAFGAVGDQAGNLPKGAQSRSQEVDIFLDRRNKDSSIIRADHEEDAAGLDR